ncbi:hypothetical protein GCM10010295_14550 [Streptomyces intermedius]
MPGLRAREPGSRVCLWWEVAMLPPVSGPEGPIRALPSAEAPVGAVLFDFSGTLFHLACRGLGLHPPAP